LARGSARPSRAHLLGARSLAHAARQRDQRGRHAVATALELFHSRAGIGVRGAR